MCLQDVQISTRLERRQRTLTATNGLNIIIPAAPRRLVLMISVPNVFHVLTYWGDPTDAQLPPQPPIWYGPSYRYIDYKTHPGIIHEALLFRNQSGEDYTTSIIEYWLDQDYAKEIQR